MEEEISLRTMDDRSSESVGIFSDLSSSTGNSYNDEPEARNADMDTVTARNVQKTSCNHDIMAEFQEGRSTLSTSIHLTSTQQDTTFKDLTDSFFKILSGIYGIFLVLLGAILPIAETFADSSRPYFFETFYVYLYVVSMLFLLYVYAYLLRRNNEYIIGLMRNFTRSFRTGTNTSPPSSTDDREQSAKNRRRKIAFDDSPISRHTGSFYLRIGAVAFGMGSMIHSGLTFGHYLEITHYHDSCSEVIQAVKPLAKLVFTFVQLYFVFLNSKMCIYRYKVVARFGLMHMCSTNICVWFRTIVVETLHVIQQWERGQINENTDTNVSLNMNAANKDTHKDLNTRTVTNSGSSLPELRCHMDTMMGQVVEQAAHYLYPCTIEYTLICAGILYTMWTNVGPSPRTRHSLPQEGRQDRYHRMSVDCAGSTKGLFSGLIVLVFAVISLIAFYVLISEEHMTSIASLLGHFSETTVYILATLALVIGSWRMKNMNFDSTGSGSLDQTLLLISLSGLMLYCSFSIVAAMFFYDCLDGRLTIVTNVIMMIQACGQTVFIIAGLGMTTCNLRQTLTKPGRECVTFLLISNFAMWAINTFETRKMEHNPLQMELYGSKAWSIFTHVSVPMGIFYRFHSTVCLSNIWKKAWKRDVSYINR